jgi:5-methyltetrahydrofolate--homocysteine methyltransferase
MNSKNKLTDILESGEVVLLDGAHGSLLMEMGLAPGNPPDEWNLLEPEKVGDIHRQYLSAGSEIILTNTFGSSAVKLARSGLGDRVQEINIAGARLAREAAGEAALIAGDIGPTGELIEPLGALSADEAKKGFGKQVKALHEGGVDLIIIETMYDLREALLALEASLESAPLPVIVSLTFDKKKTGFSTIMGNRVENSFTELAKMGASVVGANCSISSGEMVALVEEMVKSTSLPVIAQPNAGAPSVDGGEVSYAVGAEEFSGDILKMVENGAQLVGGCCGTNPEFMRLIRERLDERRRADSAP